MSDLDPHTRKALEIYIHFRASAIVDSGNLDRIKAEIEAMPEAVRQLVREKARQLYKRRRL